MTRLIKIQDDDNGDGNVFRGWDGWAERSSRQPIIIQMVSLIARLIWSPTSDSIPTSVVLIWHTRAPAAFYDWLPFWCQHHQTPPNTTRRHNARPETNFNAAGAFKLGLYFQHQSCFVPMFVCFLSLPWSLTGLPISRVIGCRKTLQQPLQPFDPMQFFASK